MIVLHIGRNKAASTTLQEAFVAHRSALAEAGVRYINFGHLAHSDPDIPGVHTAEALAALSRETDDDLLVSNEFMSAWPEPFTAAVGRALVGLPVRVMVYLRPYADWLPSLYAQDVKGGDDARDFDAYARAMAPRVSAWPMLEGWAAAFGWGGLRVRTLEREGLVGGDVVADAFHAVGAFPPPEAASARRANAAPGWVALELTRAVRERFDVGRWATEGRAIAEALVARLPDPGPPPDAARYLTAEQAAELDTLYREDLRRIVFATGQPLAAPPPALGLRDGLAPAFVHAPEEARRAVAADSLGASLI